MWLSAGRLLGNDAIVPGAGTGDSTGGVTGSGVTDPNTSGPAHSNPITVSGAGSFSNAVSQASSGDTILVDGNFNIGSDFQWQSGVDLVGDSATDAQLNYTGTSGAAILEMVNTQNVWIHGVTFDVSDSPSRIIGTPDGGVQASGITISNCTLNGGQNGINWRGNNKDNNIADISILGCTLNNNIRHGIFMGIDNINNNGFDYPTGQLDNVLIQENTVNDVHRWLAITLSGRPNCPARNSLIKNNDVRRVGVEPNVDKSQHGNAISLEDVCHDIVIEDNDARNTKSRAYGVTGAGYDNIVRNNYGEDIGTHCIHPSGAFNHSGDPHSNLFENNTFRDTQTRAGHCIRNQETLESGTQQGVVVEPNEFRNNEFTTYGSKIYNTNKGIFDGNVFN